MILYTRSKLGPIERTHDDVLAVITSKSDPDMKALVRAFSFGEDTWKVLRFVRSTVQRLKRDRLIFEDQGRFYSTPSGIERTGSYLNPMPRHTLNMLLHKELASA